MADINGIVPPAMPGENRGAGRGPSAVPARERSPVRRPAAEQGPGLSFVLHALRRWWVLATPVGLVLAALGGTIVYLLFERTYEAAAWLKIEDQMAIVFDLKYDDRANAFFKTQIEMIRSPIVLAPVLQSQTISGAREIADEPDKLGYLQKKIRVAQVGESNLFRILYQSPDPKLAKEIVDAVTTSYLKLRSNTEGERTRTILALLKEEKDKARLEVKNLGAEVEALAKQAGKSGLRASWDRETGRSPLADVHNALAAAQVRLTEKTVLLRAIKEELREQAAKDENRDKGAVVLAPEDIRYCDALTEQMIRDRSEYRKAEDALANELVALQEIRNVAARVERDPEYLRRKARYDEAQANLEKLRESLRPQVREIVALNLFAQRVQRQGPGGSLSNEMARLTHEVQAQDAVVKELQARYETEAKKLPVSDDSKLMQLEAKRLELDRAQELATLITRRELQLQTELAAPQRVSKFGDVVEPESAVQEFPFRNVALASLAGFFLPFALALGYERLLRRVSDSRGLEREAALAVLGEIARLPSQTRAQADRAARSGDDVRMFEESVDSLRTALFLSEELRQVRVLAVTSAVKHEGKTSVAAQLAMSIARASGEPALLIDGDMRAPGLHEMFDVPLEPGLAKVLSNGLPLSEAIVPTFNERLHLLPAGRLQGSPHRLLGSGAWQKLLADLPAQYRYVIVDTPPVLPASEGLVFAKTADATLICAMRDVSRLDQVKKACQRLATVGSRTVGFVLNGVPLRQYARQYGSYAYASE